MEIRMEKYYMYILQSANVTKNEHGMEIFAHFLSIHIKMICWVEKYNVTHSLLP